MIRRIEIRVDIGDLSDYQTEVLRQQLENICWSRARDFSRSRQLFVQANEVTYNAD